MKPILEVRNLWKQYKIGGQQASYLSLREKLLQPFQRQKTDTFWALQDINFDIYEGECVGIIGRNGAGKSTLLKILSQITPPTKGHIKARGRVASLLEVGTGFHPELSGRENVYLNGSILGLKHSEINAKFDEIIDFSGIEKFLDTPLKHYSSGMKLRLAFSVAAHLEPEILLIDEVLAVGDAEFQKKCLGKMDEVSKSGRTVLFVSHNLGAVRQLCSRGILLNEGQITNNSNIKTILEKYQNTLSTNYSETINTTAYLSLNDIYCRAFNQLETIDITFNFSILKKTSNPLFFDFAILNQNNETVLHFHHPFIKSLGKTFEVGENKLILEIKSPNLLPGSYHLTIYIYDKLQKVYHWENLFNLIEITIIENTWIVKDFSILKSNTLPQFKIITHD